MLAAGERMGVGAFEKVTDALRMAGSSQRHGGNWNCPTGAHSNGDAHPSLHVTSNGSGVGLYCHTGCATEDILSALDMKKAELFDEVLEHLPPKYYHYTDEHGEVLFAKLRYVPKRFSIKHPVPGGWEDGIPTGTSRVLYRLPELLAAISKGERVYLVEGEKDADRIAAEGFCATTNFDGAGKWRPEWGEYLAGADLIIIADRDEPGEKHARRNAETLKGKCRSVKVVQSRAEGKGFDVSDHLDAGFTMDELVPLRGENEITRQYTPVNWMVAFKSQPEDVQWLIPDLIEEGTLNALYSAPGVGKSLLALEVAVEVVRSGKTCLYVDQENRISDTVDRLTSFGVRPEELDRLLLYSFPSLPPLDSPDGGQHLVALAEASECSLIILDTLSRMVEGAENESDTYLSLYRNTLAPLKGRGIASLRLDHSGKNEKAGQRGSSSKSSDADCIYHLRRDGDNYFSIECEKSRSGHVPYGQMISLVREYDPLRHVWTVRVDIPLSRFEGIMRQMELLGVPTSWGRDRVRKTLKDNHVVGVRNDLLGAAITERRNRERRRPSPPVGTDGDSGTEGCPF